MVHRKHSFGATLVGVLALKKMVKQLLDSKKKNEMNALRKANNNKKEKSKSQLRFSNVLNLLNRWQKSCYYTKLPKT